MSVAGKIVVEMELNDTGFVNRVKQNGRVVREFNNQMARMGGAINRAERHVSSFMPHMRDFSVIIGLANHALVNLRQVTLDWQMSIIQANAELERLNMLLRGMSESTTQEGQIKQAGRETQFLINMAKNAPFSLKEMSNSFVKMKSVGIDPTTGALNALTDAVANFGGNDQILHRASVAIQQMAGKGVISMEELRQQLGEAVPTAMKMLSQATGYSMKEMVDIISKGQMEAGSALERLLAEMELRMGGSSQRMMTTWTGLVQRLTVSWDLFKVAIGNTGFFEAAKGVVEELIALLDSGAAEDFATRLGQTMTKGMLAVKEFIKSLHDNYAMILQVGRAVKEFGSTMIYVFGAYIGGRVLASIGSMIGELITLRTSMAAAGSAAGALSIAMRGVLGPIGLVVTAVVGLISWFKKAGDEARTTADRILDSFGAAATAKDLEELPDQIKEAKEAMEEAQRDLQKTKDNLFQYPDRETKNKHLEAAQKEAQEAEALYTDLLQSLEEAETSLRSRGIARVVEQNMKEVEAVLNTHRVAYDNAMNEFAKEADKPDSGVTQEDRLAERSRLIQEKYDADIKVLKDYLQEVEFLLADSPEDNLTSLEIDAWNKRRETLEEYRHALIKAMNDIRETHEKTAETASPTTILEGNTGGKDPRSGSEKYLVRLKANLAKVRAEIEGTSPALAKFNSELEQLEDGTFLYNGMKVTKEWVGEVRSLTTTLEEAKRQQTEFREGQKQIETVTQSAKDRTKKFAEQIADLTTKMREGFDPRSTQAQGVAALREKIWALAISGKYAAEEINELFLALEKLDASAKRMDAVSVAADYRERAKDIRQSLMSEQDAANARYNDEISQIEKLKKAHEFTAEELAVMNDAAKALAEQHARDIETPMDEMMRGWQNVTERMQEASAEWLDDASERLTDFVMTGKADFGDLAESIIRDLIKIQIQSAMSGALGGGGSGGGFLGDVIGSIGGSIDFSSIFAFEKGGIMTSNGALPLNTYAYGGIANSPQLAVFGEGSTPEAYVPLPDGKSIPVTVNNSMKAPNVQVNVINESGTPVAAEQRGQRFDGRQMVLDIVLTEMGRPGAFRDGMRGAVR